MDFNPKEHEQTAKAIFDCVNAGGLDHSNPAVQDAMVKWHEKIVAAMPHHNDADRAREITKRSPLILENIKRSLPNDGVAPANHLAGGGLPVAGLAALDVAKDAVSGVAKKATEDLPLANTAAYMAGQGSIPGVDPVNTRRTDNVESLNAPDSEASPADQNVASQNNPQVRAKATGGGGKFGGHGASGSWTDDSKARDPNVPTPEELQQIRDQDPEGAANLEATMGTQPPASPAPAVVPMPPAAKNAPPPPTGGAPSVPIPASPAPMAPSPTGSTLPEVTAAAPVVADALPSAFKNAQTLAVNESTPVPGMADLRKNNVATASKYRDTQTPEAMKEAQRGKYNVSAMRIAAAGQNPSGLQSALSDLSNIGQDNLEHQQTYGNNSLHQADLTGLDTQSNQGAGITNANAAAAQPRAGAADVAAKQKDLTDSQVDYDQVQKSLQAAGNLPSPVASAIWNGGNQQEVLALAQKGNLSDKQKGAIVELIRLLNNHPELKTAGGALDPISIKTAIDSSLAKKKNALDTSRTTWGLASGIDESPTLNSNTSAPDVSQTLNHGGSQPLKPQGYKDGGTVAPMKERKGNQCGGKRMADGGLAGADMPEGDEPEGDAPTSNMDALRKAFGMKSKAPLAEDQEQVESTTAAPREERVAQADVLVSNDPYDSGDTSESAPAGEPTPPKAGDIGTMIASAATKRGIDPRVAHALAQTESGGNPSAVGPANRNGTRDHGLFQVNDANIKPGEEGSVLDPEWNTNRGLDIYKEGLDRFNGNQPLAIYAYNHGIRAAEIAGQAKAQRDPYVQRVMANMPDNT